ncbi:hypothetical protein [Arcanobacterium phocae]|uniref:hypothetical protein n=1 Tax=Arcanobacterium phocae TaxID=131112 RepID=UPI001C0FC25F|nr:hypothetical protein [Arcanobacterium phocae]
MRSSVLMRGNFLFLLYWIVVKSAVSIEVENRTSLEGFKNALKTRPNYHDKYQRYHASILRKPNRLSFSPIVRGGKFCRRENYRQTSVSFEFHEISKKFRSLV